MRERRRWRQRTERGREGREWRKREEKGEEQEKGKGTCKYSYHQLSLLEQLELEGNKDNEIMYFSIKQ